MSRTGSAALQTALSRSGDTVVVALRGELDLATAASLRDCLLPVITAKAAPSKVVLDLADLTFLDASGISALLTVQRGVAARGGCLVLRSPSSLVRRVVRVLDLEKVLPVER